MIKLNASIECDGCKFVFIYDERNAGMIMCCDVVDLIIDFNWYYSDTLTLCPYCAKKRHLSNWLKSSHRIPIEQRNHLFTIVLETGQTVKNVYITTMSWNSSESKEIINLIFRDMDSNYYCGKNITKIRTSL